MPRIEVGINAGRVKGNETYHKVGKGVGEDLCPFGSDRGMAILEWPFLRVEFEAETHGGKEGGLHEYGAKHGEAICEGRFAEAERRHEASGENGCAACVTETEEPLERGDEFYAVRVWKEASSNDLRFYIIEQLYKKGDGIRDPIVKSREGLKRTRKNETDERKEERKGVGRTFGLRTTRWFLTAFRTSFFPQA
jgi:hypothetical protein